MSSSRMYGLAVPVDDVSPLWSYYGSWAEMNTTGASSHTSMQPGSYASITFTGTGIELNGALENNWDDFAVVVDGYVSKLTPMNPRPGSVSPLYRNMSLKPGEHHLTLVDQRTSIDKGHLRLDGGVIMMGRIDYSAPTGSGYMEDSSPNITYRGYWNSTADSHAADYINSMTHRTQTISSSATIQFYGNAIAVNGVTGREYGAYTVSLDGGPAQSFSGYSAFYRPRQVMYIANQISLGEHTLTIRKTGNDSKIVSIDSATSFTFVPPEAVESSAPASASASHGVNKPALIGGVVGGVVALLLLLTLAFVFLRRRKHKQRSAPTLPLVVRHVDKPAIADDARSEITLVSAAIADKKGML